MANENLEPLIIKMEVDLKAFEKQLARAVKLFDRKCRVIEKRNARMKRAISRG